MGPTSAKNNRWLEASSRKKRLRSATLLLSSPSPPSAKTPAIAANNSSQTLNPEVFDVAEADVDAEYKLFLEHLRVDGKSYVFEMVIGGGSGPPLRLKYEEDDDDSEVIQSRSPGSRGSVSSAARSFAGRKRLKGQNSKLKLSEVFAPCSLVAAEWEDGSMVDENYQKFLSHVRVYNGSMILELDNNVVVRYEEEVDEEEAGEERVEQLLPATEDLGKSNVVSVSMELQPYDASLQLSDTCATEEGCCSVETVSCGIPASFEIRLMSILQQPFDQKEYDKLMEMATVRTPKMRSKELRNETKIYPTKELGLSYLEYFPELARRMENKDCHERLDLLRGFFFWLQNVGHDGAYMPWLKVKEKMPPLQIEMSEK
ncbi:uncharacterized protein LOC103708496 [Phoenix dactylifera]|uniref:Uncharacterized protein LOC103708496 n=1 Tax=Phoenix dactylifera TaxID=42345 RepID=A0A8B7C4S0_PHODC|nr:uncharacterized protein LOC103708496 [Phoenix dactylifera]